MKKILLYQTIFISCITFAQNYDGLDINGVIFRSAQNNSSWIGANLSNVVFESTTLRNSNFTDANLSNVIFYGCSLGNVNFTNANLLNVNFSSVDLTNLNISYMWSKPGMEYGYTYSGKAVNEIKESDISTTNFTDANIEGTSFIGTNYFRGCNITKEQLYSTASYKNKNLRGIKLGYFPIPSHITTGKSYWPDLHGYDFTEQDLTNAIFLFCDGIDMANFTDAIVRGARLTGITSEQLYSTASYKNKDLTGIIIGSSIENWNLSNQNLTNANFSSCRSLIDTNFSNTIIEGANFTNPTNYNKTSKLRNYNEDITKEQLYSTLSYRNKNLTGIIFNGNELNGWNFTGQNLTNAEFKNVTLIETDFTCADLRGALFENSDNYITKNTIMADGRIEKFSMVSSDDNFSIRKYVPASEGGEMISAKINETAAISGGAALTLENGAELEVLNAADFTVKNGSSIIINTDADSSTSFKVNSGGGLVFENGAILEINAVSDMSTRDTLQIVIMDFDDGARIAGLDALIKDETIQLSVNGSKWLGEWDYALENNQRILSIAIPEPSAFAAIFGALALGLALKYRNYKN